MPKMPHSEKFARWWNTFYRESSAFTIVEIARAAFIAGEKAQQDAQQTGMITEDYFDCDTVNVSTTIQKG